MRIPSFIVAGTVAVALAGCGSPASHNAANQSGATSPATTPAASPAAPAGTASPVSPAASGGNWDKRVRAAMTAAASVHISGTADTKGQSVSLNLSVTRAGPYAGQVNPGKGALYVVYTGRKAFVKVSSAFLRSAGLPSSVCTVMCGKYVEVPVTEGKLLDGGLSFFKLTGQLSIPAYRETGTAVVHGERVIVLHGSDGSQLDVAASGVPYPVAAFPAAGQGSGEINFSEWNAVPPITAPPSSEVVSLGQLTA